LIVTMRCNVNQIQIHISPLPHARSTSVTGHHSRQW
jgi:hypothetical protein